MKDRIFYALEGFVITLAGVHWLQDTILPLLVACIGAVLTVLIQHYLKLWLNRKERKGLFKSNGKQ